MKRCLSMFLCLVAVLVVCVLVLPNHVQAATIASGTCGENVTWTLDDAGTLTISGMGAMADYAQKTDENTYTIFSTPWEYYVNQITHVVIEDGVTYIGSGAFLDHQNLKDVQIPSSVKVLGAVAFRNCIALESIVLPEGLTTLGVNTFYGCKSVTSVTIPTTLQNTGVWAFADCDNIKYVHITDLDKWLNIDWVADGGSSPLMSSEIGADLYLNGEVVTEIVFPEGTTSIGVEKCAGMTSLERVTILEGVTGIENAAFFNCKNLKEIKLPDSLKSIGRFAFEGAGISELVIPDGVTTICDGAFMRMLNLRSITIPDSVTSLGEYEFDCCYSLENVTLPNSIKTIGLNMFHACTSLKSITLPPSVTTIGDSAFSACWELQSITIPNSVTSIGEGAFWNCVTMDSITIPKSVVSIGDGAFQQCESLHKIYFMGNAPIIADNAFGKNDHTSIVATAYYPKGNKNWTKDVMQNYGGNITWVESDIVTHDYNSVVTPPTCTEQGYTTHTCSVCDDSFVDSYVAALGHDMSPWEIMREVTCTEHGEKQRTCSRCSLTETEVIESARTHTYDDRYDEICNICEYKRVVEQGVLPVYRLYNPYTDNHLLTGGEQEKTALFDAGWSVDGIAWQAPENGTPVYRLYNPYDDWHTYTISETERDAMIAAGWNVDGAISCSASAENSRPIYRLFNPYEQKNYHLFTASEEEKDMLVAAGWIVEGVAWYALN